MKNIILQHFDGDLRELDKLSVENVSAYANTIGADYKLVTGKPFRKHLTSPCQKAFILDKSWDDYDNVLMLDIDCFVVKGITENVFGVSGNGVLGPTQQRLRNRLAKANRVSTKSPYWSGSFYKFDRGTRTSMRNCIPDNDTWMNVYNKLYQYEDEGILAELAYKAKIPESYVDVTWNQCSFLPHPERAKIIHIRTKKPGHPGGSWSNGGKQDKILNYQILVDKGVL